MCETVALKILFGITNRTLAVASESTTNVGQGWSPHRMRVRRRRWPPPRPRLLHAVLKGTQVLSSWRSEPAQWRFRVWKLGASNLNTAVLAVRTNIGVHSGWKQLHQSLEINCRSTGPGIGLIGSDGSPFPYPLNHERLDHDAAPRYCRGHARGRPTRCDVPGRRRRRPDLHNRRRRLCVGSKRADLLLAGVERREHGC